jgi:hypothetical protein
VFTDSKGERDTYCNIVLIARAMDEPTGVHRKAAIRKATKDFGDGAAVSSVAEIVDLLRRYLDDCGPTQHLIGDVVIGVSGDASRATVQSEMICSTS